MQEFFPNQRWASEGEPELGVGIVTELSKNRVEINFPLAQTSRIYAIASAPLRRVTFKAGDTVYDKSQAPFLIERVQEEANLFLYIGKDGVLSEADLGEVSVIHGVDDRLLMGEVESPKFFALRRKTLEYDHLRRSSPISGFVGGRIDLIPHQLYIAQKVSSRYNPRVLLSDQVGLGKTIEACLILHRLLLSGQVSRVLILVPGSLVHQWFVEMLRRFNLWFHIFDEERCEALDESAPDGNPFLDDQLVICSTSFLSGSLKRAKQAVAADWDMMVVDEAHHLEWSLEKASPEYAIVEILSKVAKGLLLLTATPEQLGQESHFARLRLLDPERYSDYNSFLKESQDQAKTAEIAEQLASGKELNTEQKAHLIGLIGNERVAELGHLSSVERNQLLEDLVDQHGPGRVIFRNTRAAMSGFPKRKAHFVPLDLKEDKDKWLKRLRAEFSNEIDSQQKNSKEQYWFKEDPRVKWLLGFLEEMSPNKILLICKSKSKVLDLEKALEKLSGEKIALFHEDLTIVQRDRNAAWFAEADGASILLCSEIGSEGRNFQFAHHLVLFDLPLQPELLEQRIGRLDRIGQSSTINIHIPYLLNSPQEALVRWYHEGLNAFEENIESGSQIAALFKEKLLEVTLGEFKSDNSAVLDLLISETSKYRQQLRKTLADGRDKLLEMNSFRPKVADQLIKQIKEADRDPSLEIYLSQVFNHFGIEMEDLAARSYFLRPARANREAFPAIPDVGIAITFDRKQALSREDLSFISWDHPMVTGAIDKVLSTGTIGASYGLLKGTNQMAILLEVNFVLEGTESKGLDLNRFLPSLPIRIVVNHTGEEQGLDYPVELINKQLRTGKIDEILENDTLVDVLIPEMLDTAREIAEQVRLEEIQKGMKRLNQTMDHEIGRLLALAKSNIGIRRDEVQKAMSDKKQLAELIGNAQLRLDSLQLIKEG